MKYFVQSKVVFYISLVFILIFLLVAFSYLKSYENKLLYGVSANLELNDDRLKRSGQGTSEMIQMWKLDPGERPVPGEVILPRDYESLFYLADVKPFIKEAIYGSPFNYIPDYRNPCWLARIVGEDGAMPEIKHSSMEDLYSERLQQGHNWRLRCFPLVHMIGFAKSGTTDLYRILKQHPHIVQSRKEPLFWTLGRIERNRTLGSYIAEYDTLAEEVRNSITIKEGKRVYTKILLDASSTKIYFMDNWRDIPGHKDLDEPIYTTAMTLKALTPQAKIIIIMRNPVDRTYSRFRMFCRMCTPEEFHTFVTEFVGEMNICLKHQTIRGCAYNYTLFSTWMPTGVEKHSMFIRASLYYVYVRDWLNVFPRDQFHIIHAEDYYKDRVRVARDMYRFLDLDVDLITPETWTHIKTKAISNQSDKKGRMSDQMLNTTRTLLRDFFRPYNHMLASLLNDVRFKWDD